MNVCAIIQARMGSTRLPGKVLADIAGQPMLWRVVQRTKGSSTVDKVVVAATIEPADELIVDFCRQRGVEVFRGSESDVLDRYFQAALEYKADAIVRITSDCPLIDPNIIDNVVSKFLSGRFDYASNSVVRSYPRGLDTEVLTFRALELAHRNARSAYQRAHVTPYIYENPQQFNILSITGDKDYSDYRWSVDTSEDLELVRAVYARLQGDEFSWSDVVKLMEREPELAEINRSVMQKVLNEG